jgi:RNA ligase (TIGR02306 family)
MSLASIQPILSVEHHSNADSLDIVQCLGYRCIVRRDQWKVGDLAVLIEPDSVLPDAPWAAVYKAKSSRVKAIRLRGQWSFGVVESLDNVGLSADFTDFPAGFDVTELLGVTKWSPPEPQDLNASGPYGFGIPRTDEMRYQSLRSEEMPPWGTLVDVTLKVDGQSWSAFCKLEPIPFSGLELVQSFNVTRGVGGRSFLYKPDSNNAYTRNEARYGVLDKLEAFCRANEMSLCLRGESYGQGIQKGAHNPHAQMEPGLALFSTWLIDERRYATKGHPLYIHTLAPQLGLPTVPVLERDVPLTPELIARYDEGIEKVLVPGESASQAFEGVVINHTGGSFKVINKHYDARK